MDFSFLRVTGTASPSASSSHPGRARGVGVWVGGVGASRRNQQRNLMARLEPEDLEELSPSLAPGSEPQ